MVDAESHILKKKKKKRYSGLCTEPLLLQGNFVFTGTTLYRREFDDEWPGFMRSLPIKTKQSDYVHWLFLSSKGLFKYIDEDTTSYRILGQSASHFMKFQDARCFYEQARDVRLYFNALFGAGLPGNKMLKACHLDLIRAAASYDRKDFLEELYKGLKVSPSLLLQPKIWGLILIRAILNKRV